MIVPSMTHAEVYRELEKDREYVTRWWRHNLEAQRRRVLKARSLPVSLWFDYTSPRKVRYLFFTRIFDKKMRRILIGACALRHTPDGLTAYTTWLGDQVLIRPMVLTPHMFKQYARPDRANVQKTGIELIKHYFFHNSHGKDTTNPHVVGRSVRYNGEEHQSCCVNEGVLLGQVYDDIYVVRTFITYEMTSGLQEKEFCALRQKILDDRTMYEVAKGYYIEDKIPYSL